MTEEQSRDFKGVWISKTVWLDERLSALDKIIFAEIDSLDGEHGCFANNSYLAKFCQCSETKVSTTISKLISLGYLEVVSFNGRNRTLKSRLSKIERQTLNNCEADTQILNTENTNIDYNNKVREKRRSKREVVSEQGGSSDEQQSVSRKRTPLKPPTIEEVTAYAQELDRVELAQEFFDFYELSEWKTRDGKKVKDWQLSFRRWIFNHDKWNNENEGRKRTYRGKNKPSCGMPIIL